MRLVLHPGHSKCGSSTIQRAIIKNRNLLEKKGYVIPDPQMRTRGDEDFNPNGLTPRPFFRYAMEQQDLSPLQTKLECIKERFSGEDRAVLISAENLVNQIGKPSGLNIHRMLSTYFDDFQVLYYIRRQDKFIMSAWQQWGYKQGLSLEQFVNRSLRMRSPNYRAITTAFSDVYGRHNVRVIPVEANYLHESDLISDFFKRLGLENGVKRVGQTMENRSLNPYICECLSTVGDVFRDVHDESMKTRLENVAGDCSGLFMKADGYFPYELRQRVMHNFKMDNIFLSDEYIGGSLWPTDVRGNNKGADDGEMLQAARQAAHVMTIAFSKELG